MVLCLFGKHPTCEYGGPNSFGRKSSHMNKLEKKARET
jgi:hypothetical protein